MQEWHLRRSYTSSQGEIRWDAFGDGPPVVLLHGTPSSSFLWRDVAHRIAARHRVHVFDWPGYGQSARHIGQNLSWDEQARHLPALFTHWGLEGPAIVAHDIASVLALRAHFLHGLPLGPLVLADAALVPPFVTGFSAHVREHIGIYRGIPVHIAEAMVARHLQTTVHQPMTGEALDGYMRPWRGAGGIAAYWRVVAAYDEDLARPVVERLAGLKCPTLVLWGEEDTWEPYWKADELADAIPGSRRRLLAGAGHFATEDAPEAFASVVLEHFRNTI